MFNHHRYLIFSGTVMVALLLLIAIFNYIVDPYNMLGNNRAGTYFWHERQMKGAILTYDHEAILIGSSKTAYINPDDLSCYRFYNASMRGMLPEEMFFYLKKYLRNEKLVLIGFDFYMFNEREFPLIRINDWNDVRYTMAEYLFGVHTVEASFKTLKNRKNREPIHGMKVNGQFDYPGATQVASAEDSQQYEKKYRDIIKGLTKHHYGNFSFSQRRMSYVMEIKRLFEEKGIPYAIFINPENHDVFAALQQLEAYHLFVSWQQEMKTVFPGIHDYSYSRYSARNGYYGEDPYHYTNATGKAFLNEILKTLIEGLKTPIEGLKTPIEGLNDFCSSGSPP